MIDVEKVKDTIAHTAITVGAPITGGGIGIVGICEKIAPVLTVISLLFGMALGVMSFILKRRLLNKQISELNRHQE
jgi:hypothetical protein